MNIATLIAAGTLGQGTVSRAVDMLVARGLEPGAATWLEEGRVCDVGFDGSIMVARTALRALESEIDIIVERRAGRAKQLLVADMDSTMITVECIDELADYAGMKPEVSAITERAMAGELDFAAALAARVALLAGMPTATIAACRAERVRLMPGARTLVRTMRAHGAATLLVSGGFTAFAEPVAAEIGFDKTIANRLGVCRGVLTGQVHGPIVDAARKAQALQDEVAAGRLELGDVLAVGDGANDLPMIVVAGLGIAYHAKPVLADAADARIRHNDLTALLWSQGYARRDWVD